MNHRQKPSPNLAATRRILTSGVRRVLLASLAVMLLPRLTLACATCFGAPGSSMTKGTSYGVFFMLGVVVFVQLGFVALFWSFWRRAQALRRRRDSFRLIDGGALHSSHSRHF